MKAQRSININRKDRATLRMLLDCVNVSKINTH